MSPVTAAFEGKGGRRLLAKRGLGSIPQSQEDAVREGLFRDLYGVGYGNEDCDYSEGKVGC